MTRDPSRERWFIMMWQAAMMLLECIAVVMPIFMVILRCRQLRRWQWMTKRIIKVPAVLLILQLVEVTNVLTTATRTVLPGK